MAPVLSSDDEEKEQPRRDNDDVKTSSKKQSTDAETTSTHLSKVSPERTPVPIDSKEPLLKNKVHYHEKGVRYTDFSFRRKKKFPLNLSLRKVVERVSQRAALSTKKAVWDSNEISVDAALRAVDQWEALYSVLRGFTIVAVQQGHHLYQATKLGASKMEQGLLRPLRDFIVLPTFGGIEQAVLFLKSDQAVLAADQALGLVRQVPLVGEHILCPALLLVGGFVQTTWQIVQYPIPSKRYVRDTVEFALTSSKWALLKVGREFTLFFKRADANITRTLSHTQWKVLGSGPYATLDQSAKQLILAHITERYCSLHPLWNSQIPQQQQQGEERTKTTLRNNQRRPDHDFILSRYELAAHIKRHNPPLYLDLIQSGLLMERAGPLFQDDQWLKPCPSYRSPEYNNFLIPNDELHYQDLVLDDDCAVLDPDATCHMLSYTIMPLWFRLPSVNGKKPGRDAPWICFSESDQHDLEYGYRAFIQSGKTNFYDDFKQIGSNLDVNSEQSHPFATGVADHGGDCAAPAAVPMHNCQEELPPEEHFKTFPTIAQWYTPNSTTDILVDQKRHAVTLSFHCPKCKKSLDTGKICLECLGGLEGGYSAFSDDARRHAFLVPPPVTAIMRPTMWRFHGQGDLVRRSNWFLDTPRNGLQPFDEDAQAVLEDAYLFLKWMSIPVGADNDVDGRDGNTNGKNGDTLDGALLTVEVTCPDGADRLIQFGSLTQATAIQKGLSAAFSINKIRVYRGAWLPNRPKQDLAEQLQLPPKPVELAMQESILRAAAEYGTLGETTVPNACLRDILKLPAQPTRSVETISMLVSSSPPTLLQEDLAVPASRLFHDDMAKHIKDPPGGPIDHLCLIVHGIGEMLQTIDLFGLALPNLATIVDCCGFLRRNHSEVQRADFSLIYPTTASSNASRGPVGRVEYLPVEWHEAFSILSRRRTPSASVPDIDVSEDHVMLKDISLPTIPNMREFANDTLMDVLYFMSPEHHDIIIEIVAHEMNVVVDKFRKLTGFSGHISIIGHSLGSIIAWDILANQQPSLADSVIGAKHGVGSLGEETATCKDAFSLASDCEPAKPESPDIPEIETPPSSVTVEAFPQLKFRVNNFFLMGSPIAVFLMIRNQRKPLPHSFYLNGCRRVFNIFHPYDPVAYRLEPCIAPRNADFEPTIIKHWNGGFRVQYQTRRFWKKFLDTTWETKKNVAEAFEASMAGIGLLDFAEDSTEGDCEIADADDSSELEDKNYVITGQLNRGRRIDYMLQEKEIESANEYVAALAAHSCYWTEKDLSLFIAWQISVDTTDQAEDAYDLESND